MCIEILSSKSKFLTETNQFKKSDHALVIYFFEFR